MTRLVGTCVPEELLPRHKKYLKRVPPAELVDEMISYAAAMVL